MTPISPTLAVVAEAESEARPVHIMFIKDEYAKTFTTSEMQLWDLRDLVLTTTASKKVDLPWLKLATFGDVKSDKGSLRHDKNVIAISGVELDYDAEVMGFDEALAVLRKAQLQSLIYTSPSHTLAKPRWRILAPTSCELPPQERSKLVARINGLFGGIFSTETFTLSQAYYYGAVSHDANHAAPGHRAEVIGGDFVDLRPDLDATARWKERKSDVRRPLTDVAGLKPDVPITSLDDDRLKSLSPIVRYMIKNATPPDDASEKVRKHKGGAGHSYVIGALVRAGLNNSQIKSVYRLGRIANGPNHHARGFDGYVERTIALCRPGHRSSKGKHQSEVVTVRASDVVMRAKQWIWENHLLRGAQELLTGIPGLGKSQVQISYIACVTAGLKWPDNAPAIPPANVLMITAEDTLDQEVIPRLIAAGADLDRVHILNHIKIKTDKATERQFLLAEDLDAVERKIKEIGDVALLTIDPITAYMGGRMDSHKATEVRSQLGPLKDFAERTGIAISTVTHPAKTPGLSAINQFIGSQAFIAAGRIGHVCIAETEKGEDDEGKPRMVKTGRVLFAHAKHNPSGPQPTWAFRIGIKVVGEDPQNGKIIDAPYVVWDDDPVDLTADQALAAAVGTQRREEQDSPQRQLQNFLITRLKNGPVPETEIEREVVSLGFTKNQLYYAKKKLGIVSEKTGYQGAFMWRLAL